MEASSVETEGKRNGCGRKRKKEDIEKKEEVEI